jgi:hypothetical protein
MPKTFQEIYDAKPFDPNSRPDQLGEIGRQVVLKAAAGSARQAGEFANGQEVMDMLGGMMVGLVQVAQASLQGDEDRIDAAIREMLTMNAAWAVDLARSCEGKDPLPSA